MSYLPPCPNCGAALQVSNQPVEKAYCPMCDQVFAVRQAPTPAPTPYQPPAYTPQQYSPQGYPPQYPSIPASGLAIASMVLGIVALVLFCVWPISIPCGVIAIILGALGASECKGPNPRRSGMGMAIAGITCSAIGVGLWILVFLLAGIGHIGPY